MSAGDVSGYGQDLRRARFDAVMKLAEKKPAPWTREEGAFASVAMGGLGIAVVVVLAAVAVAYGSVS